MTAGTKQSSYIDHSIPQLVAELRSDAVIGSQGHAEIDGALRAKCAILLADAIDKHQKAATSLSNRLFWLNIILGIFTVIGACLG